MRFIFGRCAFALLMLQFSIPFAYAQDKREPLSDRELIALVAGNSLSEGVVHEIESRGLDFLPDDQYRSLLTKAGGDMRVLAALRNPKTTGGVAGQGNEASGELLQHLSSAGKASEKAI